MSAQVRQALADAASTVEGVHCTPHYRQITKPGEACVRFDRMNPDANRLGFMTTWQIWVVLPHDLAKAEQWLDKHVPDLIGALEKELVVTSVAPEQTTTAYIVVIEGARESGL